MSWHGLAFAFTNLPQGLFQRSDDDMYDRLSHRWTSAQLIGFALLVTMSSYVGDPIRCWTPAHFTKNWDLYANSYCWIRNTYYLPLESDISPAARERDKHPIIYYQWVSMILLFQALLFYFPLVIWRTFNDRTGIDMNDIIETAEKVQYSNDLDYRNKLLTFLAQQTHRYLGQANQKFQEGRARRILRKFCCLCGKRQGNFITLLYIFVKLLFLLNVAGQVLLLNKLLGQRYAYYGIQVLIDMYQGNDWSETERFPRVAMCDIDVRRLGNNNKYTVQCVLTVNFFTEKIYLYLWWWLAIVALFTLYGLILLIVRSIFRCDREVYVQNHLLNSETPYYRFKEKEAPILKKFVSEYLRADGVLLMRLVGHNTNKVTVTDFICACYEFYRNLPKVKKTHGSYREKTILDSVASSANTSFSFGDDE